MPASRFLRNQIVPAPSASSPRRPIFPGVLPSLLAALLAALPFHASAQTITWSSESNAINSSSSQSSGMSGFRFELGVFTVGFIPTRENIDQWSVNWQPAQVTFYNPSTSRFAGQFTVTQNTAPFTSGADAYIWGFNGSPQEAEWILFRNTAWKWPLASGTPIPVSNNSLSWVAEQADIVFMGDIQRSGNPYLMKTASVSNKRPPNTSWQVWIQQQMGADSTTVSPNQDADNDGALNILEFVMGSNPKKSGGVPATPVQIVNANSNKYLQISVPRRIDHTANLTVQVANHPAGPWLSGPDHTTEIANTIDSLIVRDNTPISPTSPHRFMRLHVDLPAGQ